MTAAGEPSRMATVSRLRVRMSAERRVSVHHWRTPPGRSARSSRRRDDVTRGEGGDALPLPGSRCTTPVDEHGVELGEVGDADLTQHLARRSDRNQPATGRQHDHAMASLDVFDAVRREHDGVSVIAHPVQPGHEISSGSRIEAAGRLIEEADGRAGQDLCGDVRPLAFAAAQRAHGSLAAGPEPEGVHRIVDRGVNDRSRCGDPQGRGVAKSASQRQLAVQDVVLRDEADAAVVDAALGTVKRHAAFGRGADSGKRSEQRALAGTAGSDTAVS